MTMLALRPMGDAVLAQPLERVAPPGVKEGQLPCPAS